jgi:hypothetical protein
MGQVIKMVLNSNWHWCAVVENTEVGEYYRFWGDYIVIICCQSSKTINKVS